MAKIKIHPNDPTMFMFWDIGLNEPNAFYIRPDRGWTWNFNFEIPSVSPSVLLTRPNVRSHLFIKNGKIHYLSDCTHRLAGQIVEMVDFPEDW